MAAAAAASFHEQETEMPTFQTESVSVFDGLVVCHRYLKAVLELDQDVNVCSNDDNAYPIRLIIHCK